MDTDRIGTTTTRRDFIFRAAALSSAALVPTAVLGTPSNAARYARTLEFSALGQVQLTDVLTNQNLVLPSLPPGAQFWLDMDFAVGGRDVLDVLVYVTMPAVTDQIPISQFQIGIEHVKLVATTGGWINFDLSGTVTHFDSSPFANFQGYPAAIGGRYKGGTFDLIAGNVFGSHVSVARTASGVLEARLPYRFYD